MCGRRVIGAGAEVTGSEEADGVLAEDANSGDDAGEVGPGDTGEGGPAEAAGGDPEEGNAGEASEAGRTREPNPGEGGAGPDTGEPEEAGSGSRTAAWGMHAVEP